MVAGVTRDTDKVTTKVTEVTTRVTEDTIRVTDMVQVMDMTRVAMDMVGDGEDTIRVDMVTDMVVMAMEDMQVSMCC